jgi:hypothetical protein
MYIYNVTVNIEDSVHDQWKTWMLETHIPEVLNTGMFMSSRFCQVMIDEESGTTYSIQYVVKDLETYQLYQEMYAPALQKEHTDKFGGKFVAFRTMLKLDAEILPAPKK